MDIRHLKRTKIVQNLFARNFQVSNKLPFPEETKTFKVIENLKEIDGLIKTYASRFPLESIAKTDLAILRLSVYELLYEKKTPAKVVIDEAIELAKELSGENSYAFVNAILGKLVTKPAQINLET